MLKNVLFLSVIFLISCESTYNNLEEYLSYPRVYYQLVQYDFDGSYEEFNVKGVRLNSCTFEDDPYCYCAKNPTDPLCASLSITISEFTLIREPDHVVIRWETSYEKDNDYVNLFASHDLENWNHIYTEKGDLACTGGCSYMYIDDLEWLLSIH